jgi:hypothetical protein
MAKKYNEKLQTNNSSLEEILDKLNNLPDAGGGGIDTSDATATAAEILADKTAYVNGEKIIGTMPTVEQQAPMIIVNQTNGLITATAPISSGYVSGSVVSSTYQMAFQSAQTITPSTVDRTISANTYLGGVQTIKGDSNLVPENIVKGKKIFGVSGNYSSGAGDEIVVKLLTGRLESYTNTTITTLASYAFAKQVFLERVNLPECNEVRDYAFYQCNIASINLPKCIRISAYAFHYCGRLTSIDLPQCTYIGGSAFTSCTNLSTINLPLCTEITSRAFQHCSSLKSVYLPICPILQSGTFEVCTGLMSIDLPECTSIGGEAFGRCSSLTQISLPKCKSLGSSAFSSCTSLSNINLPSCTTIGYNTFCGCTNLTTISVPVCKTIG